jgi:hypothetical protein
VEFIINNETRLYSTSVHHLNVVKENLGNPLEVHNDGYFIIPTLCWILPVVFCMRSHLDNSN